MRSIALKNNRRARRLTAITAIVSLITGGLAVGITAQMATAAPWAPAVAVQNVDQAGKDFVLAGENVDFAVDVRNSDGGHQFNLSLFALVPESVDFVQSDKFGAPTIFAAGDVLPNRARTVDTDCTALGLVAAPVTAGQPPRCAVPAGQQVWVWSNVNDLPQGATVSSTVTVAPDTTVYPVGSTIAFSVRAYTSSDPARLPTFDGSTSVSRTTTHTSGAGTASDDVPVQALRVTKSEPSVEDELLRGVHDSIATYTIRVKNTNQGATNGVTLTDYLPAGLEYLGLGTGDNTSGVEYDDAKRLSGGVTTGETVETVQLTAAQAAALGLPRAGVYTKVTWLLGDLAPDATTELRYHAAVPLFENAMWPTGTAPSAESGTQAANLDNNTGPSTRHGGENNPAPAQSMENVAAAAGTYQGAVFNNDAALRAASDDDSEIIEAVDVRVVKSVDTGGLFSTGEVATYSMKVDVSEYVDAHHIVLTDVIPNGLCPAFPAPFDSGIALIIGDLVVDQTTWNTTVAPGDACNFPAAASGAVLSPNLHIASIRYAPEVGTFTVTFEVDDIAAGDSVTARYSVMQRPNYSGTSGGTSSGDSFVNTVTVTAQTEPIAAIANDPELADRVGGTRHASDDSSATITSKFTDLHKHVLERGQLPKDADAVWSTEATQAFSPGDDVWYRVMVPFAPGIDTRNPILTDYLPEGVALSEVLYEYQGIAGYTDATTPVAYGSAGFPTDYIPNPSAAASSLTWEFGARNRNTAGSSDRFMPAGSSVTMYVRAEVQAQSASRDEVDSPENQAKYQQVNVDGEIAFERRSAGIDLDWGSTLTKGIRSINGTPVGQAFGSEETARQVVQGDKVAYRIDVKAPQNPTTDYVVWDVLPVGVKKADVGGFTADLYDGGATPQTTAIDADDMDAVVYDAGDTLPQGIALSAGLSGRSVVAWTIRASVAGSTAAAVNTNETVRGFTLGYTLTVPSGVAGGGAAAQLTQSYVNDAGIVSYGIENSATETTTVVPQAEAGGQQLTNRTPQAGEVAASDIDTVGSAEVHLPDVSTAKKLISTEVGPTTGTPFGEVDLPGARNTASQIVQGEHATFEYSLTIPARTTIRGAVLSDNGSLATGGAPVTYQYVEGSAKFFDPAGDPIEPADEADGFRTDETVGATHGVLTFPSSYTNTTNEPQTFRVQISAWVKDRDNAAANASAPQIANGTQLTNTATATFLDPNSTTGTRLSRTATAQVQFIEPAPALTKTTSSQKVAADGTVKYTLTASNGANRAAMYDTVVLDCVPREIAPSELTPSAGTTARILDGGCAIGTGNVIQPGSGTGTLIEWTIPVIQGTGPTGAPTLTYTGKVEAQAGGGSSFVNRAELKGYTLPLALGTDTDTADRRGVYTRTANATVTMPEASILKTVSPGSAAVGETVTYTLKTMLPASTNFYDVVLTDKLPAGVEYLPTGTHTEVADWKGDPSAPTISAPTLSNGTLTWRIDSDDVLAGTDERTITVTFQARITNSVVLAKPVNTGTFAWSSVNGSTVPADRKTTTSPAEVTILNPNVTIAKQVKLTGAADTTYAATKTGNPDQSFTYRVRATNGGNAPAYGVVVTDRVDAGIRIDTDQSVFDTATFSDETALQEGRGGTITWTVTGPLSNVANANTQDFVYQATFVASSGLRAAGLRNDVAIPQYSSAASDGWTYRPGVGTRPGGGATIPATTANATVTPLFPNVVLAKRVTDGAEAFVGEAFSWTLQARNTGTGSAQTITLTDTLPLNWEYDSAVTPTISVGGQNLAAPEPPVLGRSGARQTVTWTIGSATGQPLLPGTTGATDAQRTVLVTFSSKPLADAVTDAGAGLTINHSNTVAGSATDTTGATRNATAAYAGPDAQANANIARADLKIVKAAIGGDAQGAWTAGDSARPAESGRAAYTQPQWRITVTNQGIDAAKGPFRIVDTTELPAGVTTGSFTAKYFANAGDANGTVLTLSGAGTASDPFVVGDRARTLKADGTDRIVLVADVTIQSPATGTAKNTASVTGRTFERPADIEKDNTATVSKPISSAADLAIEKSVNTTEVNAGRPITWSIKVRNNGPSVSVATDDDKITVTDTIPDGISGVQDPSAGLTAWTVAASDGWPAAAGDTITWTYTGTQLAVGPAQDLSLSGIVDSSWTGGDIVNTATVTPGATTDPVTTNNEGSATATPGVDTTLAVTKTRVVLDDGVWKDASQHGSALPDTVAGETVSYRVIVTNNGPADAQNVTVTDKVPAMLAYASVRNENGTWTRTAGPEADDTFSVAGTLSSASGSNTRSFIVTYTIDSALAPGSVIVNRVIASADNSTNEPSDSDTTDSDRVADLSIVKQAIDEDGAPVDEPEVTAGTQTRFRLTVTNNGPSISSAPIDVSDRLPAGMTYVSSTIDTAGAGAASASPVVTDGGRALAWAALTDEETLAAGDTIVIEVTAAVAPDVRPQRLINTSDVSGPEDSDPTNNHSEAAVDIVTLAEMTIDKTVADGPWIAGTEVSYTLTVNNEGPSVADASVADVLPDGLTAVSISGSGWTCDDEAETCLRAAHPLGESTITVVALIASAVPTGTELTNTVNLSWTDSRSTSPHSDSDDAAIDVTTDADLQLVKTAVDAEGEEISTAIAGEAARYRIEVENLGTSDAVGPITVVDTLPAGIRFVGLVNGSSDAWTADADDADPQSVTFTLLPEDAGLGSGVAAPAIEFEVSIDAAVAHDSVLTNTATVSSETPDSNPENDGDTADLTVAREVDLSVTKTHDADAVRIGDELPFTLEVRNAGPSEATDVVVTDTVPAGLEVVTVPGDEVGEGWTIDSVEPVDAEDAEAGTRIVARYASALAPGATATPLVVTTRVLVSAYSEVVNVADVTAGEITEEHPDRNPDDNRVEDAVTVPPMAALVVTKTAVGAFQVGKVGTYEIVVRNDGPTADPGPIAVTDALPEGLSFAGSPDEDVRVDGRVVTWTLAEGLALDEQITLTLKVNVAEAAYPSVTNVVTVESPTEQTEDAQLTADATVTVAAADPLATTGAEVTWGLMLMALLLMLSGGLFVAARRRVGAIIE